MQCQGFGLGSRNATASIRTSPPCKQVLICVLTDNKQQTHKTKSVTLSSQIYTSRGASSYLALMLVLRPILHQALLVAIARLFAARAKSQHTLAKLLAPLTHMLVETWLCGWHCVSSEPQERWDERKMSLRKRCRRDTTGTQRTLLAATTLKASALARLWPRRKAPVNL